MFKALVLENRQLKDLLPLRQRTPDTVATGRVVGSSFNSARRYAILSVGASGSRLAASRRRASIFGIGSRL